MLYRLDPIATYFGRLSHYINIVRSDEPHFPTYPRHKSSPHEVHSPRMGNQEKRDSNSMMHDKIAIYKCSGIFRAAADDVEAQRGDPPYDPGGREDPPNPSRLEKIQVSGRSLAG